MRNLKIKTYGEFINEAIIRDEKVRGYVDRIFNYINKRTDNYNPVEYEMSIQKNNSNETLNGKLFLGFDGSAFRINWSSDKEFSNIQGIDYWEKYKLDSNITPTYSMEIKDSIVPLLPIIADFIIKPTETVKLYNDLLETNESYKMFEYYENEDGDVEEDTETDIEDKKKVSDGDKRFFVNNPHIDRMSNEERKKARQMAIDSYRKAATKSEKQRYKELANTYSFSIGEGEVMFDDIENKGIPSDIIFDPFYAIEEHTYTVAKGEANSLLISGLGGLGKTFEVEKTLKEMGLVEDKDFEKVSGSITVPALYAKLYKNRNGLLLFDDCDSFWFDKEAANYLKAALDTKDVRVITRSNKLSLDTTGMTDLEIEELVDAHGGDRMPEKIRFTGQIIFISNLPKSQFDEAVLTRVIHVDVALTREEIIARMDGILPHMRKSMPLNERMEVYHFLQDITTKYRFKFALNMRTLQHCFSIMEGQKSKYNRPPNEITRKVKRYNEKNEIVEENMPTWKYLCYMFLVEDDKERTKANKKGKAK
jgi:hypothetical protein